ncbi:transcription termination factor Rho, partial [Streptomyces fulvissimus]|nr:transcription termination factor Rho [Streptomyces microflavus]
MSDTTDLMGVTADKNVDSAAPAEGAATGTTARRRRSGTGLEGMVLAELQQVASGLGIRGTARMRKSQLIEVIKETQAGGGSAAPKASSKAAAGDDAPAAETESKPKRRATSKARTGDEAAAEKAAAQQQIDIPGQPASDEQPTGERRRRRATAQAGSPDTKAEAKTEAKAEPQAEQKTEDRGEPKGDAKAEAAADTAEGRRGDRQGRG